MIRRTFLVLVAFGAVGVAWAQQPPAQPSQQPRAPRQTYSDRYGVLSQRNIFLRDRSRGGSGDGSTTNPSTSPSTQASRRSPEESLLLRGIVVEEGEVRAYFEDVVNSTMLRVSEGDKIARGRVASIGLDAVEYEPIGTSGGAGAEPIFVAVGNDLTGKIPDVPDPAVAAATTSPVMPSGIEGLNPNDPNLTLEQKLKLRRAMELKK